MKINILQPIAGVDFSYKPGDIVELPIAEAARWIRGGIAAASDSTAASLNWPRHIERERRAVIEGLVAEQLDSARLAATVDPAPAPEPQAPAEQSPATAPAETETAVTPTEASPSATEAETAQQPAAETETATAPAEESPATAPAETAEQPAAETAARPKRTRRRR